VGHLGESIAALFLEMEGYRILSRNARLGRLEVDLIAVRDETVAFVEVRTRTGRTYGRPEETVRGRKRRNILRAAAGLISRLGLPPARHLRFDLIAIERQGFGLHLRHLPGWTGPVRR
jgi:putative endonuclease